MDERFLYCVCIHNSSVQNSEPVTGENSQFCYVFRVFDPPTHAPYLQQMPMHMSAMEKHVDTSKKHLRRITNFMTTHNNKRKRDGIDEEDNDSSIDDK
jgi:hypothetical protein